MTEKANRTFRIVLAILGFLLLWEWLQPIQQLTDTGYIGYFVLFVALILGLLYTRVRFFYILGVALAYIFFFIHRWHFSIPTDEPRWLSLWTLDMIRIIHQDWELVSDSFRTLLFFFVLWMMSHLLYYWLQVKNSIFLFYVMTVLYITILDTFTPYDGTMAIIRAVIFGFLLLGLLTLKRIIDAENISVGKETVRLWTIPLAIFIAFSSIFSFVAPKFSPIWPDPVPYIKSYAEGAGEGEGITGSVIRYSFDDTQLGGPFIGDNHVVFSAAVRTPHYWRVESKDTYTGKGWEQSKVYSKIHTFVTDGTLTNPFHPDKLMGLDPEVVWDDERIVYEATVNMNQRYRHLVYPYGTKVVEANDSTLFHVDFEAQKIETGTQYLASYSFQYQIPVYDVEVLRQATIDRTDIDLQFLNHYTQLPDNLPQRVIDLAQEIVEGKENWYDQAKAIEDYFQQGDFVYDQVNVPYPRPEQDYVDQFLFETKRGYCDNYSTAMVVLLRAVGVPARWVKGYTAGEYKKALDSTYKEYRITNYNAHSWVEVFFPDVGWVPFEPTKGFNNYVVFQQPDINDDDTFDPSVLEQEDDNEENKLEEKDEDKNGVSIKEIWEKFVTWTKEHLVAIGITLLAVTVIIWVLYLLRRRWLPYWWMLYYRFRANQNHFPHAYEQLLHQLKRYGLTLKDGQTLRSYAKRVDEFFSTDAMSRLTLEYEKYVYRGQDHPSWDQTKELWEYLIKKTTS
jgi:transglutaminase-like putative cysteine protease